MRLIVTTSQSVKKESDILKEFIKETEIEYVPRNRKSIAVLSAENDAQGIIVWHDEGPVLHVGEEKLFFHPSMAKNRLASYRKYQTEDLLIKACEIKNSDSFLDCTLGMGADAIVASYFSDKPVLGLESSFPIAVIIKWGMKTYQTRIPWLTEPIKKIEVCHRNHYEFLKELKDDSLDIVYFDPMFRQPLMASKPINALRAIADPSPVTRESIAEACRVARKKVVMKEQVKSSEFEKLNFNKVFHSPHNRIGYGIITV
ncbi:MAG: class I SAM-dependent methyltransferase [Syntrophomonadaceae bacterium]|jgi:16S rRNA G966 N2-methylase RsmD|nr:class I SAM-dependent methyltransferase [Syntrophomonadaceae bacterium]